MRASAACFLTATKQAMRHRQAMRRFHTLHASSRANSTPPMGAPAARGRTGSGQRIEVRRKAGPSGRAACADGGACRGQGSQAKGKNRVAAAADELTPTNQAQPQAVTQSPRPSATQRGHAPKAAAMPAAAPALTASRASTFSCMAPPASSRMQSACSSSSSFSSALSSSSLCQLLELGAGRLTSSSPRSQRCRASSAHKPAD